MMKSFLLRLVLALLPVSIFGCATDSPHLMATPVVFKDERLDFMKRLPVERRTVNVPIFYATTRERVPDGEPGHYSAKPSDEGVQLGVAHVALGEPGATFDDLVAVTRPAVSISPARDAWNLLK